MVDAVNPAGGLRSARAVSAAALAALCGACVAGPRPPDREDEMQPPKQTVLGGDEAVRRTLSDIHRDAERMVLDAERAGKELDLRTAAGWEKGRSSVEGTLSSLITRCYHDGVLGPATGAVSPGAHLERLRKAWGFQEATRPLPAGDRRAVASLLAGALRDVEVDFEAGDDRIVLRPKLGAQAKWVAAATPQVVLETGRLTAQGPAAFLARVDEALGGLK